MQSRERRRQIPRQPEFSYPRKFKANGYYQRLDFYHYYSIIRALQNNKNFSHFLFNKSLLKVCNDQATKARSSCSGFYNANFELTRVHYCYIFWYRSSYAKVPVQSQWKKNYGCVSLRSFKALSVEFGENLGQLQSVKLFGNLTFYRNLLKISI